MPKSTKYKYYCEDLIHGGTMILDSMVQLIEYTDKSYRSLQRWFRRNNVYYHPTGKFKITKSEWIRDNRVNNTNPNI